MTEEDPRVVRPADLLSGVRSNAELNRFSGKLLSKTDPPGTPNAKMRLGLVVAFDATTWTVTALIGDQLTQVSGIPVLAGVVPVVECAGYFGQVGGDSTTEYTLLGMLVKGPGNIRIRKPSDQAVTNSATAVTDTYLKFYALAGRTYIYDALLLVTQNGTTLIADVRAGWIMPSGATFSGGAIGPIPSLGASEDSRASTGAGANWRAQVNTVGTFPYGTDPNLTTSGNTGENWPIMIRMQGTIKMGATSGQCSVAWAQETAQGGITTRVKEGSYLKVDMTSEYTL